MAEHADQIRALPPEVQVRINSSAQIGSINQVVLELVKNALDAQAGKIEVRLDLAKNSCSVLDNGLGISRQEFLETGGLGKLYHTSKTSGTSFYGRFGRFLAALSDLSLLSITSKSADDSGMCSVVFKNGRRVASIIDRAEEEELARHNHGTKVKVYDLFSKLPVRLKYRLARFERQAEAVKEFEALKRDLVTLLLATDDLHDLCFNEAKSSRHFRYQVPREVGKGVHPTEFLSQRLLPILIQSGFITRNEKCSWKSISASTQGLRMTGAVRLKSCSRQDVQFISLNQDILDSEQVSLYGVINGLFKASSLGLSDPDHADDNPTWQEDERAPKKRIIRAHDHFDVATLHHQRPAFYFRIEALSDYRSISKHTDISNMETSLQSIQSILTASIMAFLQTHGFHRRKNDVVFAANKKSTNTREHESYTAWSNSSLSRTLSRVRSARGMRDEFRSGLPFSAAARPTSYTSSVNSSTDDQSVRALQNLANPETVAWADARSGEQVYLDSRTGASLQKQEHKPKHISLCHRDIAKAAEALSTCGLMTAKRETQLASIVPSTYSAHLSRDYAPDRTWHDIGHDVRVRAPTCPGILLESRITREALGTAKVIGQVDRKFILLTIIRSTSDQMLVLVDQHAADERIKVESLFSRLCADQPRALIHPIIFEISVEEEKRFREAQVYLARWNIAIKVLSLATRSAIHVTALPDSIAERCRLQPEVLIGSLRTEVWNMQHAASLNVSKACYKEDDWPSAILHCPQFVLDMQISRACRSAVMFNDELSAQQCRSLIQKLSKCVFPFQCAHGRPGMTVVAELGTLDFSNQGPKPETASFLHRWRSQGG